jgi:hypothetical protein
MLVLLVLGHVRDELGVHCCTEGLSREGAGARSNNQDSIRDMFPSSTRATGVYLVRFLGVEATHEPSDNSIQHSHSQARRDTALQKHMQQEAVLLV